jgi:hypothetical protein
MFPSRAILYAWPAGSFFAFEALSGGGLASALPESGRHEPPAGECAMRFIFGLIVGVVLTVGGAAIHDKMEADASKQLVSWTNANELQRTTYDYLKSQFDRLMKWATSSN